MDRASFEEAIKKDKYDQDTRLVFADWLEENGFDEEALWQRKWTIKWQKSEDWLLAFCKRVDLNFAYFIDQAGKYLNGELKPVEEWDAEGMIGCHLNTSNASMDEDMPMLWLQTSIYLRREEVIGKEDNPFSCGGFCFLSSLSWNEESGLEEEEGFE